MRVQLRGKLGHVAGVPQNQYTRLGCFDPLARAVEQRGLQTFFRGQNATAQGSLTDAKRFCGAPEVAVTIEGQDVLELLVGKIHAYMLSIDAVPCIDYIRTLAYHDRSAVQLRYVIQRIVSPGFEAAASYISGR